MVKKMPIPAARDWGRSACAGSAISGPAGMPMISTIRVNGISGSDANGSAISAAATTSKALTISRIGCPEFFDQRTGKRNRGDEKPPDQTHDEARLRHRIAARGEQVRHKADQYDVGDIEDAP